jgi:hypothetical protein
MHELKKVFIALALLCLAYSAFALEFRKTSWLMTKAEVIASENSRVVSEQSFSNQRQVVFQALIYGYTAIITYLLEDDKLVSASYTFKKDMNSLAFEAMKKELLGKNGAASFQKGSLLGWRLANTEIALTHLADGTTQAGYWEKAYFARMNNLTATDTSASN